MAEVKIFHDRKGQTLTVGQRPFTGVRSEETGDEVVLNEGPLGPSD